MKLTIATIVRSSVLMGLLALAAESAGCEQLDNGSHRKFFPPEENRKSPGMIETQVTNGAKEDATLQSFHFDGTRLNSNGAEKLARMVPHNQQDNLVVYLNVPGDQMMSGRREAVANYLSTCGLEAGRLKIETGTNPNTSTPTASMLPNLIKTDSGTDTGTGSGTGGAMLTSPAQGQTTK